MSDKVVIHKGRTNTFRVNLGMNVSADTFTSEIRTEPMVEAPLIAEWNVRFVTDGSDGKLILTLDNTITKQIKTTSGYMDFKRITGSEPVPIFDKPLEVEFRGTVTDIWAQPKPLPPLPTLTSVTTDIGGAHFAYGASGSFVGTGLDTVRSVTHTGVNGQVIITPELDIRWHQTPTTLTARYFAGCGTGPGQVWVTNVAGISNKLATTYTDPISPGI